MGRFFRAAATADGTWLGGRPAADAPYAEWHAWSCEHPEPFWAHVWRFCGVVSPRRGLDMPPWRSVLDRGDRMAPPGSDGPAWFPGATLNFAENLLRRRDATPAIIARSEGRARRELSFAELADQAGTCAAALSQAGVGRGDCVAGLLPNIPEAVIAMLGAATLGAMWTSCSPDFGVKGVLDRFGQVRPRVLVCADGYRYAGKEIDCLARIREIVEAIPSIERVVVVPFLRHAVSATELAGIRGGVAWDEWAVPAPAPSFAQLPFDHPLYVMYSSGTTGLPKCMVHGAGGTLLQHLKEHQLHCDIGEGDRVFYFTTCGWMMWNWLVSALASGAAIVLYDGAPMPPGDPAALWRMAAEERVTVFGTSATFVAACEKAGIEPAREHDLGVLRMILSTGSPLADHSFDYVMQRVRRGVHLASISGGTDLISCFALGNPLLPVWRGELQCAGLGMAVDIFDEKGKPLRAEPGELVCTRPFPSMPIRFRDDPDGSKYRDAYFTFFPGVWRHGDWVERTAHDGFIVHGRSDATLNPGGVRIGTAEIYRQVEQVPGVAESIVVGQDVFDAQGGTDVRIVLFVRLADGATLDDALRERIRRRLRDNTSPHHVPRVIAQVTDIPRTISGKITELAVRDVIHGRAVRNADALANPGALEEYRDRPELRY
jgi:acetoacetyl-CoA synthetase